MPPQARSQEGVSGHAQAVAFLFLSAGSEGRVESEAQPP